LSYELAQLGLGDMDGGSDSSGARGGTALGVLAAAEQLALLRDDSGALGNVIALSGNDVSIRRFCCRNCSCKPWHVLVLHAPSTVVAANAHLLECVLHERPLNGVAHAADPFNFSFDVGWHHESLVVKRKHYDVAQPTHAIDGNTHHDGAARHTKLALANPAAPDVHAAVLNLSQHALPQSLRIRPTQQKQTVGRKANCLRHERFNTLVERLALKVEEGEGVVDAGGALAIEARESGQHGLVPGDSVTRGTDGMTACCEVQ
jgi:hypothetical protein